MKILAIDTSSTSGSVAVMDGGTLCGELTLGNVGTHSQRLLRAVDALLEIAGLKINDIDLFAVAAGPGSFTGLRIGITTVKGLAWTLGKDIVPVSTLAALARNLPYAGRHICPVLDARKGEVYAAIYSFSDGILKTILPDSSIKPDDLFDTLESMGLADDLIFVGSGLLPYGGAVASRFKNALAAPSALWQVRASNIALEASDLKPSDPSAISPVYLRKSEAELKSHK